MHPRLQQAGARVLPHVNATTPVLVLPDGRRVYQCATCGALNLWGEGWGWFGSLNALDGGLPGKKLPPPIEIFCSDRCRQGLRP